MTCGADGLITLQGTRPRNQRDGIQRREVKKHLLLQPSRVLPERAFSRNPTLHAAEVMHGDEAIRRDVLLVLRDPSPQRVLQFQGLSLRQWRRLATWLDLSGLALYFFNKLKEARWQDLLPAIVSTRLEQNLADNTARTRSLIDESIAIQRAFQDERINYAALKGISFWPRSVPKPELRSQFDLDFLVVQESVGHARDLLERRGYRLYATCGRSMEFKRNERPGISARDMYKDVQSWKVELHVEPVDAGRRSQLARLEWRQISGFDMPVLSPVDLFIGQGLHVYRHVCGEFLRASLLEEVRRHILYYANDGAFWSEVRASAEHDESIARKLGLVERLIAHLTGEFAPDALTSWTSSRLSDSARLWIEVHGSKAVLGDFPGSKRARLLMKEMGGAESNASRKHRHGTLLPLRLPPQVIRAFPNENFTTRLARHWMQLQLIIHRAHFHLVAGIDFFWESRRWQRLKGRAS